MKYVKLLDKLHKGLILKIDGRRQYTYSFGPDAWIETALYTFYTWPESDLYDQYEEVTEVEAIACLAEKKAYYLEMLEIAIEIAKEAHKDQVDKAGQPYINHPLAVAASVQQIDEKIVALLHDVIEDSYITSKDLLKNGFDDRIVRAVSLLTKVRGKEYGAYLEELKKDLLAKSVKIADLKHNSDINRIPDPTEADFKRILKYKDALVYLEGAKDAK